MRNLLYGWGEGCPGWFPAVNASQQGNRVNTPGYFLRKQVIECDGKGCVNTLTTVLTC